MHEAAAVTLDSSPVTMDWGWGEWGLGTALGQTSQCGGSWRPTGGQGTEVMDRGTGLLVTFVFHRTLPEGTGRLDVGYRMGGRQVSAAACLPECIGMTGRPLLHGHDDHGVA
jgi:hypothetical protein